MSLLWIVVPSAVILIAAYFIYGSILARLFQLDPKRKTPAFEMQDGLDYEPLATSSLVPQHFSAIAAAGPIVGPILAGLVFGWLPALIWIIVGSILIGGVHDFSALVASIRHKARSIAEVVRDNMSRRSYLLFLAFIWIALVYIIIAFTDVTASTFIGAATPENGNVGGGAIATASLLYLLLTVGMGLCIKYLKLPMGRATLIFSALVIGAIIVGPYAQLDVAQLVYQPSEGAPANLYDAVAANDASAIATASYARKGWDVVLLLYCLGAGVAPVWLILQPRGQLGGYFLYAALAAGAIGLVVGGAVIQYPAFRGFEVAKTVGGKEVIQPLFPLLFIMIACGACSGFHSLIASGTTSKQLKTETDARVVGYGTMLMEAMVAIISLSCVMMFAAGSSELKGGPNLIYAQGISEFLRALRIDKGIGMSFALMAFATFVYDTLDVCTRLGRFIIQELTGMHNQVGRYLGTGLTAGVPVYFLLVHPNVSFNAEGAAVAPVPVYMIFWNLFGASNQLLAALTLLGVTVWLWRTRRAWWIWIVTGIPTAWMYVMSIWALVSMTLPEFYSAGKWKFSTDLVAWAGVVLIALAALMLIEAIRILLSLGSPPNVQKLEPAEVPAQAGAAIS
jgi:carbon starvation protein